MATSKTLNPTNVTISIPAMSDVPDAAVFSNCVDKEADAINVLGTNVSDSKLNLGTYSSMPSLSEIGNGVVAFLLNTAATVDGYSFPAGIRIVGYKYSDTFHGIAIATGNVTYCVRWNATGGWTVLQNLRTHTTVEITATTSASGNINISSSVPAGLRPVCATVKNETAVYLCPITKTGTNWLVHIRRASDLSLMSSTEFTIEVDMM